MARALAGGLCCEKGLEGLFDCVPRHARTGISHANADILARCNVPLLSDITIIKMRVTCLDCQHAASGHRIARIDRQVQNRTFELVRVTESLPKPAGCHDFEANGLADGPSQQVFHARDEAVCIDRFGIEGLAPRVVQQMGATLQRLKAEGYTLLLVSQNLPFAARLADRFYLMEQGRIVDCIDGAQLAASFSR